MNAAKAAIEMYEGFVQELSTALFNTVKFARHAYDCSESSLDQRCLEARIEAFEEIIERVDKERQLARQELDYAISSDDFYHISESIAFHKNLDCENLMPDNEMRGRPDFLKKLRFRGRIADLLEGYAQEGFNLGVRYTLWRLRGQGDAGKAKKFDREEVRKMIGLAEEDNDGDVS